MQDLTAPAARTERDQLATRVDVLDKVGVLATLPDDMHVLTPMVAEFYGVGVEAIKSLVKDNRDEMESDGYRVVVRSEFERFYGDPANLIDPRSRQIALFPRRAVLRVGMLLRDSPIARQVRDYLLTVEEVARESDDQILEKAFGILRTRNEQLAAEVESLKEERERERPAIEYVHTHVLIDDDVMLIEDWGRAYGLTEPQAFALLRDEKSLIYAKTFERWSRSKGCKVTETEYRPRAGKPSFTWFDVKEQRNAPRRNNGQARKTCYIKAIHAVDLARLAGLLPNIEAAS
ncbi:antirepressor [Gordonia phage Madeline]|uniref:Antirepressor n=2 Tax=Nymbaxtervirinae TaxID=2169601 RepID=A0A7G8LGA4_9CAUD|nr:antirepressor [Gordonia phage Madeline]YP_010653322.1 antirepressor [Gordonia phage Ohgeesy]QDH47647.1 antirepressor [Gordonia phage Madeline]QNJ56276.1 antirepressor [Gordonia phage Ohgeesy]